MEPPLRELAAQEKDLPEGHPDWQHVAFGWRCLALAQRDSIDSLEEELKRMSNSQRMFQEGFYRQQREIAALKKKLGEG